MTSPSFFAWLKTSAVCAITTSGNKSKLKNALCQIITLPLSYGKLNRARLQKPKAKLTVSIDARYFQRKFQGVACPPHVVLQPQDVEHSASHRVVHHLWCRTHRAVFKSHDRIESRSFPVRHGGDQR